MSDKISLKDLERNLFRGSIQDGIIDIQIGCVLLMFAIAPLLSETLGDFWSSAVFLPFWAVVLLGLKEIQTKIIRPRIGTVKFGAYRKNRLQKLNWVILGFNLIALGLGILSFVKFSDLPGWIHTARFSIILLVGFSLAGYLLEFTRLYLYGILVAFAPLIGEYLHQSHGFSHHGFPVTFGILAAGMIFTGLSILILIVRKYPDPAAENPS